MTPVWKSYFKRYDPVAVVIGEPHSQQFTSMQALASQFSYPLDDRLSAEGESSEAIASFMSTDSTAAQYGSALSLYIGVGGQ